MTIWGTFNLLRLAFLRTNLEYQCSNMKQIEWDAYFNWHLAVSKSIQDSKIASFQNTISELTKVNKQLKADLKKKSTGGFFIPFTLCTNFLFSYCTSLYPLLVYSNPLTELLLTSSFFKPDRNCPFKTRPSEDSDAKLLISYVP